MKTKRTAGRGGEAQTSAGLMHDAVLPLLNSCNKEQSPQEISRGLMSVWLREISKMLNNTYYDYVSNRASPCSELWQTWQGYWELAVVTALK